MFKRDQWEEIIYTISKNKLRTALSGFTIALGVFIFVVLFGFGNGLKNGFSNFFMNDNDIRVMRIFPAKTFIPYRGLKSQRQIRFENEDLKIIEENFGDYIDGISPRLNRNFLAIYKNQSNNFGVRGVSPEYIKIEKIGILSGRFLNQNDINGSYKHAVIGNLIKQELFKSENPINKFVILNGTPFKVIGVFEDVDGDNEEKTFYVPYTSIQSIEKNNDKLGTLLISVKENISYSSAILLGERIVKLLKRKYLIHPKDRGGIFLRKISDELNERNQFATALQIIVSFVGLGTLLAGIIGVSNIMVFIVKERTKELGIKIAIGATPSNILNSILQESIFITTISGLTGLLFGVICLELIGNSLSESFYIINPHIKFSTAIIATIVLIILGSFAGFLPARQATKIKPIEAINGN